MHQTPQGGGTCPMPWRRYCRPQPAGRRVRHSCCLVMTYRQCRYVTPPDSDRWNVATTNDRRIQNVRQSPRSLKTRRRASIEVSRRAIVFTARCYASAVLAVGLCPCPCPSVTNRSSTKTDERIGLVFGMGASFIPCVIGKFMYLQK